MAPGPLLPQLDEFVAALVERYGDPGAPVVLAGNPLGGVAALRAAQGAGSPINGFPSDPFAALQPEATDGTGR